MKNKLPIESDILFNISGYTFDYLPQMFPQSFCSFGELHTFPTLLNRLLANIYNRIKFSLDNLDKMEKMELKLVKNREIKLDNELSVKLLDDGKIEIIEENGE